MKVLALDYGAARTGVAVSDPTGTLARPALRRRARRAAARASRALAELVGDEDAERVVVGLPLTLRGERGAQAEETERFVEALRRDRRRARSRRSTSASRPTLAAQSPASDAPEDARAAAHLLSGYLDLGGAGAHERVLAGRLAPPSTSRGQIALRRAVALTVLVGAFAVVGLDRARARSAATTSRRPPAGDHGGRAGSEAAPDRLPGGLHAGARWPSGSRP